MPRLTLTATEKFMLGLALVDYAQANGLSGADALVAAANTTMNELQSVATQFLNQERAKRVTQLGTVNTRATAETNTLNAEIAAIDSALLKL